MPHLVSAVTRVHDSQLAAATKIQDVVVKAARKIGAVGDKAPDVPERVARPLRKVTGPVTGVIGSPSELATLLQKNARDWTEFRLNYQTAILEALTWDKSAEGQSTAHAVPLRPKAAKE